MNSALLQADILDIKKKIKGVVVHSGNVLEPIVFGICTRNLIND